MGNTPLFPLLSFPYYEAALHSCFAALLKHKVLNDLPLNN